MTEIEIPIAELREHFEQDPETARIRNRKTGSLDCQGGPGYRQIRCFGRVRYSHRIAFALCNGRWPVGTVDHVNGDRKDNRPENLREASRSQNQCNRRRQRNNTSGTTGIHYHKASGRWQAYIAKDRRQIYIGLFASYPQAVEARTREQTRLHGVFSPTFQDHE